MRFQDRLLLAGLLLVFVGCPQDDDDSSGDDDAGDDDAGDDDAGDDDAEHRDGFIGGMQVNQRTTVNFASGETTQSHIAMVWDFHDQPWPGEIFGMVVAPIDGATSWEVEGDGQDCGWLTFDRAICDPMCEEMAEYCDPEEGVCKPYPAVAPAGTLSLQGPSVSMEWAPDAYWNQEVPAGTIAMGDTVELSAGGGATPAFSVSATAVPLLEHALVCDPAQLPLPGESWTATWTPAGAHRVRLEAIPWNHGGAKDRIYCDIADTGSVTVPAAIVDQFLAGGDSFYGLLILTRYQQAYTDLGNGHEVGLELANSWMCYRWF